MRYTAFGQHLLYLLQDHGICIIANPLHSCYRLTQILSAGILKETGHPVHGQLGIQIND
ncbi:hypothetical protein D1872_328060 [compost metagenome]